jgi:hypothetical protein
MSQAEAAARIEAVKSMQGWDDVSMVDLLTRYIVQHDDNGTAENLAHWLEKQADSENKAAAASML